MYIIVSLKQKFRPTFTTACSFIVNKLCAADSNISPVKKKMAFTFPFLGSGTLLQILPLEYFSTIQPDTDWTICRHWN